MSAGLAGGLLPCIAAVLTELINSRMVANTEVMSVFAVIGKESAGGAGAPIAALRVPNVRGNRRSMAGEAHGWTSGGVASGARRSRRVALKTVVRWYARLNGTARRDRRPPNADSHENDS